MDMQIMLKLMNNLRQLRQHERWTRSQLEAYQAEAFRRQREYAYAHSPFYQRFHKGLTDRPLQELPVLTKDMDGGLARVSYRLHFSVVRGSTAVFSAKATQNLALLKTSRGWRISGGDAPQLEDVVGIWPPR